jgi:CPA2 family monovalent cation:H+ antiporter-2
MAGEAAGGDYKDLVLFLATAGVVVPILRRWRISPVLGFLAAGVLLGPFGLGALHHSLTWLSYLTIESPSQVAHLAEFGVVFLLFMIGLELSWDRLWTMRRLVFGLGGLQVVACTTAIAVIAACLGHGVVSASVVGMALALSSTAIVMPLLGEQKRLHSKAGRATFSVLLLQDLAVAPILVTVAFLGSHQGSDFSPKLLLAFAPAAFGLLGLVGLGRVVLRPMMRSVAKADSQELFMAASLLVVIGAGLAAAMVGLSMALGAFIAGLLLAETEHRKQIERTVEPFKGLLLGLFFVSVGISLDLSRLADAPVFIVSVMLGVMALNGAIVFALARLFGLRSAIAEETALLLAAGGEFSFVVLHSAMEAKLVDRTLGQTIVVASTLSMFCIPILAAISATIRRRVKATRRAAPVPTLQHRET